MDKVMIIQPNDFNAARARKVKLVQLPYHINGKSCQTCHNFESKISYCDHPEVEMHVDAHWACDKFNRPDIKPAEPPAIDGNESIQVAKEQDRLHSLKKRFQLIREKIYRFSDCGHTESGEFDHGNTCASLRGSKSHTNHAQHLADNYKNMNLDEIDKHIEKFESMKTSEVKEVAKHLEEYGVDSKASKPKIIAQIKKTFKTLYFDNKRVQGIINQ